jgi:hypothetical protein
MKDNAQENIVNYDGNARPGELVLNLETDPPTLYVGNNLGQLTLVSTGSGGASNKIYNGTSSANIAAANGNLVVNITGNSWTFGTDGELTTPQGGRLGVAGKGWTGLDGGNGLPVSVTSYYGNGFYAGCFSAYPDGNVNITTYTGSTNYYWNFDNTGVLSLPVVATGAQGIIATDNAYPTLLAYGSGGGFGIHGGPELDWMDADDPANTFFSSDTYRNTLYINSNGLYVGLNENGNANHFTGNLTLSSTNGDLIVPGNIVTNGASGNITGANVISANVFSSAGNTTVGNLLTFANLAVSGGDPLTATDTTIAFKIPVTINGNVYYLSLTAAQ